ncbi:hypothetical protein L2Y96_14635 [Luteibacter aegosomaticola]|uniref:hypothetical protein n=1 Tax=Luteibacter aegosomaticola TaxID=2911538 RepID=UPI001FFBC97F|nr:hypothetical protein [Luteibacter aegosomaticola]UPG88650.1 hypothetical protein L2Y96_14635 [Luteibacter aegosomaticola]
MRSKAMKFSALVGFASATVAATACPVERAHYKFTTSESTGYADFVIVPRPAWMPGSDDIAAFHLSFEPHRTSATARFDDWFIYDQGSSGIIHLLESTDRQKPSWDLWELPHEPGLLDRVRDFIAWGKDEVVTTVIPSPGSTAPVYIFLPHLTESIRTSTGMDVGRGMFKLHRCESR